MDAKSIPKEQARSQSLMATGFVFTVSVQAGQMTESPINHLVKGLSGIGFCCDTIWVLLRFKDYICRQEFDHFLTGVLFLTLIVS